MRTPITLFAVLAVAASANGQSNLIENSDFETFVGNTCPPANVHATGRTPAGVGWSTLVGTPDHLCSYSGGSYGNESPHLYRAEVATSGSGYIFLNGYNAPQNTESFKYTPPVPLYKGMSYTFSFWGKDPLNFEGGTFQLKGASGHTYVSQYLGNVNAWTSYSFTFIPVEIEPWVALSVSGDKAIALDDAALIHMGPLPLRLLAFQAAPQATDVSLFWEMAEDDNIESYSVERSLDGYGFKVIGILEPRSDHGAKTYRFTDADAPGGAEIYYRIRLMEKSGDWHFTWTLPVRTPAQPENSFSVSPNPTSHEVLVTGLRNQGEIRIFSADGVLQATEKTTDAEHRINLARLPSGMYTLQYISDAEVKTTRFIRK